MSQTERRAAELEEERLRDRDWLSAFDDVLRRDGAASAKRLMRQLQGRAANAGVQLPFDQTTPYLNTITAKDEPKFDGSPELERQLENIIRWNAMAIVAHANQSLEGIGGHIGSYASAATLFEVGFNHIFRGEDHPDGRDQLFLQGHASPGVYARAYLEGRLTEQQLKDFRRELQGGLPSYPHPWLMPDFWEFPSVSMGLSPIMAIYQARFNRYLENRGLTENTGRVWAIVGDGELDEPESMGALRIASREKLSNLTFVVDCNLQRLDGPVTPNRKLVQELEASFRGAGWNVIKVLWGSEWDDLLGDDVDGVLLARLEDLVDGELQKYIVEGVEYFREKFPDSPQLHELISTLDDEQVAKLLRARGGHDIRKVHAAMKAAEDESERPTVILAQTIKGYGLGDAGEALNVAHKTKTLDGENLRRFRDFLGVPIGDDQLQDLPLYRPDEESELLQYLKGRRQQLGGWQPARKVRAKPLPELNDSCFSSYDEGSGDRPATTTMIMVRLLADLLQDEVGELIVPIVPDEARTFGVEALFPRAKIYSPLGQQYEPVDADTLLTYTQSEQGQILEEGISEAGAMSSTIAAGTAYATHGVNTIPFYFFYSMFGFQRVGDLIWAAADCRTRGFLIGATSGRSTLNGEGLQHQDGHSHLLAYTNPRVHAFDPALGYEVAAIVKDGIRRMYTDGEDFLYYITVANEAFQQPARPDGVTDDDILGGLYRYRTSGKSGDVRRVQLLASGPILWQALEAQRILADDYGVTADVWSVTSWKALHEDALEADRDSVLGEPTTSRLSRLLGDDPGTVVAVSDYMKALPYSLARWMPGDDFIALGTDGFGRSDSRPALRDHFEIDVRWITYAALRSLANADRLPDGTVERCAQELKLNLRKANPRYA